MTRYLALLRGINVGGNNILNMGALRQACEGEGFTNVATYIQSGNLIFDSAAKLSAGDVEQMITSKFGLNVAVVLRTHAEFEAARSNNPFRATDPKHQHIGFAANALDPSQVAQIDARTFAPDQFAVVGREVFFDLSNGMGNSKLVAAVQRKLNEPTTLRNLNTVNKLSEMLKL